MSDQLERISFMHGHEPITAIDYLATGEDHEHMERAHWLGKQAMIDGNNPIGFVLVGPDGDVFEGKSREFSEKNLLGHAEHDAYIGEAQDKLGVDLTSARGYGNVAPCIGCAYMFNKGGLGTYFFSLDYSETNGFFRDKGLGWREVFESSRRNLTVIKGLMKTEAEALFVEENRIHSRY